MSVKVSKKRLDASKADYKKELRQRIVELRAELDRCIKEEVLLSDGSAPIADITVPNELTTLDVKPSNLPNWILGILSNSESPISKDVVEAALRKMNVSNSPTLTNAISTATKKLEDKKLIKRSKKGRRAFCKITSNGRKVWNKLVEEEPKVELDELGQFTLATLSTEGDPVDILKLAQAVTEAGFESDSLAVDIKHTLDILRESSLVEKQAEGSKFLYQLTNEGKALSVTL